MIQKLLTSLRNFIGLKERRKGVFAVFADEECYGILSMEAGVSEPSYHLNRSLISILPSAHHSKSNSTRCFAPFHSVTYLVILKTLRILFFNYRLHSIRICFLLLFHLLTPVCLPGRQINLNLKKIK